MLTAEMIGLDGAGAAIEISGKVSLYVILETYNDYSIYLLQTT